jgi:O-Antigen ligase
LEGDSMNVNARLKAGYNNWLDIRTTKQFRLTTIAGLSTAVCILAFILSGQLMLLTALTGSIFFVVLTYFQPLPAVFLAMLLSTDVLKFVDLTYLPYLPLGPGGRLNAQDLTVLLLLGIAVLRLRQHQERPLFLRPLLLLGAMVVISSMVGLVAGTTSVNLALNGLRTLSGFLFYICLVGVIDSPARLRALVRMLFVLVIVSVCVQLVEASLGQRITTPTSVASEYFSRTVFVAVEGQSAPYLWNRSPGFLFVGLFLALSAALWTRSLRHAIIGVIALLGFGVALIRQWFIYIAIGMLVLYLLPRKGRLQAIVGSALVIIVLIVFVNLLGSGTPSSSHSLVDVWVARMSSLANFQQERNFVSRTRVADDQMKLFMDAPLFGYGPGSLDALSRSAACCFSDTGMPNTLVQFGFFGWAAVVILIVAVLRQGYMLIRAGPRSRETPYGAALLSVWVGIMVAYGTGLDFFTSGQSSGELGFAVGLVMALIDRQSAFAGRAEEAGA